MISINPNAELCLDKIMIMKELEKPYKIIDYFQVVHDSKILESRRVELCKWMYNFVDTFDLNRDIVSRAMSYLDRFLMSSLSKRPNLAFDKDFLQLSSISALNIAIKLYSPRKWDMKHMVKCSSGKFAMHHFVSMEQKMLHVLSWRLNPPTSAEYVMLFVSILYDSIGSSSSCFQELADNAIFFTELSVWDCSFIAHSPSIIAIASILNAIDAMGSHKFVSKVQHFFAQILELIEMQPEQEYLSCVQVMLKDDYLQSSENQKTNESEGVECYSPISVAGFYN